MSIESLIARLSELADALEADVKTANTRQDSIRLTARAIEARDAERLARMEQSRIGETVNMLRDEGLPY